MADGANAEFGRSQSAASSTSSPSRAPTSSTARRTTSASTTRSLDAEELRRHERRSSTSTSTSSAPRSAGRSCGTRLFFFLAYDTSRSDQTKQTDPTRIDPRVVDFFARARQPERERPDRAHQRRARVPRQDRLAAQRRSNLLTLRYNYTWSEQENGTFDVDSWGRSANAHRAGPLARRQRHR